MGIRQPADIARANIGIDAAVNPTPFAVELDHRGRGNALAVACGRLHQPEFVATQGRMFVLDFDGGIVFPHTIGAHGIGLDLVTHDLLSFSLVEGFPTVGSCPTFSTTCFHVLSLYCTRESLTCQVVTRPCDVVVKTFYS